MGVIKIERWAREWKPVTKDDPAMGIGDIVDISVKNKVAKCTLPCQGIRSIQVIYSGRDRCRAARLDGKVSDGSTHIDEMALCGMVEQPAPTSGTPTSG